MNNNFVKFTFLVVVIGAVLFSRIAYPVATPANLAKITGATKPSAPAGGVPTFVLPPASSAAVSAESGAGNSTGTDASIPVALQNAASLVADIKTGTVYDAVRVGERWPTASLAKLMTATVVLDNFNLAARITITEPMFALDPTEQTLVVGGTYTAADLLNAMLLPSSNVAAEALAAFYGKDAFLQMMNARAAAWGMEDTHFDDPSGISAADQSTASDLLKLAKMIYTSYPRILQITRTLQAYVTEQNSGKKTLIKNINGFAGEADFVGGKTGHTNEASGNLLSVFRYNGHSLLIIVLGSDDRFSDTQKLYDWYKANIK